MESKRVRAEAAVRQRQTAGASRDFPIKNQPFLTMCKA